MADDLGDEWWLKGENEPRDTDSDETSEAIVEKSNKKKTKNNKEGKKAKKRKAQPDDDEEEKPNKSKTIKQKDADENNGTPKKKKKKRKRKKISEELAGKTLDPGSREDFLQIYMKTYGDKLSALEWDELKLEARDFLSSNPTSEGDLCTYLNSVIPDWSERLAKAELDPGSPVVLMITSSGVRAVELNRDIQKFKGKECRCAKLFAKHFKLEEQSKFLSKKSCHLGIGTPNRIGALLKLDSLKLDNLLYIFVDWNWRDVKFKSIVDIPEVKKDLFEVFKNHFIPHIRNSSCKIGLL